MNKKIVLSVCCVLIAAASFAGPPGWKKRWSHCDEFNSRPINHGKWHVGIPWWSGGANWTFTANNVWIQNQNLIISGRKQWYNGKQFTSGALTSKQKWQYGFSEARYKCANGNGNSSFWFYGFGSGWKHELDVQEGRGNGSWDQDHFRNNLHRWVPGPHKFWNQNIATGHQLEWSYRTYGMEWWPKKIRFFYENGLKRTHWHNNLFTKPQNLILSMGLLSWPNTNWQTMNVDWVRTWYP